MDAIRQELLGGVVEDAVKKLLRNGGNPAKLRAAEYEQAKMHGLAPLWKNTQEQIDDAANRIGREGLVIANDFINDFPVSMPEWLGVLQLTSHKVGESRRAQRGMVPGAPGEGGLQDKTSYTLPIYVTWDTFGFNVRELEAARKMGRPLETDEIEQAFRNVNYAVEDAIINGAALTVTGNTTPGMLNTTNTQAYTGNEAWDNAGHTGAETLTDVLAMRKVLSDDKFYGPYRLYIPTLYGAALQKPFDDTFPTVTRQQYLEGLSFGGRNLEIRVADLLPANRTLLVQESSSVCDVIVGQQPIAINPAPAHEWSTTWVVFACIVPRIKSDYSSNFGICAGNTT